MSNQKWGPPTYGNIGKSFRDLWSKKFEFKNFVKFVHKVPSGLLFTTCGCGDANSFKGCANIKYSDSWGDVETDLESTGRAEAKATFTGLVVGGKATLSGGFGGAKKPTDKPSFSLKGGFEESHELFTGSVSASFDEIDKGNFASNVTAAGTLGLGEGIAVGGEVKAKVDHEPQLNDYNLGVQYQTGALTVAGSTEKRGDVHRLSAYYQTFTKDYTLGVELVSDEFDHLPTAPQRRVVNVVTQYEYNPDLTAKFRWSDSGEFGLALEHRLRNPNISLLFSSSLKSKGSDVRLDRFGVGFTLGDYDAK